MSNLGATISVSWGYDVEVSIRLTPRNWARIKAGKPVGIHGKGYYYEGEFFQDYWNFDSGLEGRLLVLYGKGRKVDDMGTGFDDKLVAARVEEDRQK